MPQAKQKVLRPGDLAPAAELADTLLRVANDQAVLGNRVQGKVILRPKPAKLRDTIPPVILERRDDLRPIDRLSLTPSRGDPRVTK